MATASMIEPESGNRFRASAVLQSTGVMARPVRVVLVCAAVLGGPRAPVAAQESAASLSAFQATRVERLLDNRLACRGCHQIGGRGGMIGPILDGIRDRAELDYVLRMIGDPAATVPGTLMPHQRMPEREALRLAAYIMSLPANPSPSIAAMPQAPVALPPGGERDGAALYARHCAACHGASGGGDGWNVPNLGVVPTVHADAEAMAERPDDTLYDGIAAGGFVLDKSNLMPAFGDLLEPEQIRALVLHIRALCGCEQPVWARGGAER
jgi:mono/diheme cytochrome c family protein